MANNPFKQLPESDAQAPDRLRRQILGSYSLVSHTFKIIDLYLGNMLGAVIGLMSLRHEKQPQHTSLTDDTPKPEPEPKPDDTW